MGCTTSEEKRSGVITMKGGPLTLLGPALKVGDKAPEATLYRNDLSEARISDYIGSTLILSATPSVDTGVCDLQVRRFNEEAAKLPGVKILNISVDLPFALGRYCEGAGIDQVETLSDYRHGCFGKAYGLMIDELRLLARAVLVVDPDGTIRHLEIVPEVTDHPDYEAALAAAKG